MWVGHLVHMPGGQMTDTNKRAQGCSLWMWRHAGSWVWALKQRKILWQYAWPLVLAEEGVEVHLEISSVVYGLFAESMAAIPSSWMQVFCAILFWWLQHLTYWVYSFNDMAQVMHTSTKDSIASDDATEVGIGIRPGKGNCTATAAKSSDVLVLALLQIFLHFSPFQMLLAFSNALNKLLLTFHKFIDIWWVCLLVRRSNHMDMYTPQARSHHQALQ